MQVDLTGMEVIVTGATGGIGQAVVNAVVESGGDVYAIGRDADKLTKLKNKYKERVSTYLYDNFIQRHILASLIGSEGSIVRGYVSCVGLEFFDSYAPSKTEELFLREVKLLQDFFNVTKFFMRVGDASIVAITSVSAYRGTKGMSEYAAIKGAYDAAIKSLANTFATRKSRVNSIVCGAVTTPMHDRIVKKTLDAGVNYKNKHLLGFGSPEDVANAAVFLLSDKANWITGTNMVVDGGYLAKG